jgi:hypothetical protein
MLASSERGFIFLGAFGEFLCSFFLFVQKKEPPSSAALVGASKGAPCRYCSPAMAGQGGQHTTVFTIGDLMHYNYSLSLKVQLFELFV